MGDTNGNSQTSLGKQIDLTAWMTIARAELGQKEIPGSADNARIVEYLNSTNVPASMQHDSTAWCAAFVSFCLIEAGKESLRNAWAASWMSYGDSSSPVYGAIAARQGHVGFVVEKSAGRVKLLGGNQGDSVSEAWFDDSGWAYRWPKNSPHAPPPEAKASLAPKAKADHFAAAVDFTLAQEGLFSDHPADNGSLTMRGVTIATYKEYRRRIKDTRPVDRAAMLAITVDEAKRVAKLLYWDTNFDELKSQPVAVCLFDWCWGHGPHGAKQMAQACANTLGASLIIDGIFGPATVAAVNRIDPKTYVLAYAELISRWYASFVDRDPRQRVFLKGWMNRVQRVRALVQ